MIIRTNFDLIILIIFLKKAKVNPTFISEIFGGSMVEVRTVNKNTTGNREPFMILPLVIKVC